MAAWARGGADTKGEEGEEANCIIYSRREKSGLQAVGSLTLTA